MIELTVTITMFAALSFLVLALSLVLAKQLIDLTDHAGNVTLKLADRLRGIVYQAAMDAITVWASGHNSALDIDQKKAELEHHKEESELAIIAQRNKLELGREYAQIKLKAHRHKLLGGKPE